MFTERGTDQDMIGTLSRILSGWSICINISHNLCEIRQSNSILENDQKILFLTYFFTYKDIKILVEREKKENIY